MNDFIDILFSFIIACMYLHFIFVFNFGDNELITFYVNLLKGVCIIVLFLFSQHRKE